MTGIRTEKNFIMHEFIGLHTTIIDTPCKNYSNIKGKIIDETMKTFKIEYQARSRKKVIIVPKHKTTFQFTLNENDFNLQKKTIKIDGTILTKRPEDRIKKLAKLASKLNLNDTRMK